MGWVLMWKAVNHGGEIDHVVKNTIQFMANLSWNKKVMSFALSVKESLAKDLEQGPDALKVFLCILIPCLCLLLLVFLVWLWSRSKKTGVVSSTKNEACDGADNSENGSKARPSVKKDSTPNPENSSDGGPDNGVDDNSKNIHSGDRTNHSIPSGEGGARETETEDQWGWGNQLEKSFFNPL